MTDTTPYSVPREPGRWRAISLAVVVHLALFAFLWIGVRWQNETPVGVEAEVWSPQNQEAAPRPEPPPAVEEKPVPAPQPEPKPVVQQIPKPPIVEPAQKNPDIALEQEKKRKAQEKREREEQEKQEKQAKLKQQKLEQKLEQERDEKLKQRQAENERIKKEKADALAKQKAEAQAQKEKEAEKEAQAKKLAADKKRKQDAQDAAAADQRRAEDMKRMLAQAGTGGTGTAATAQGSRADTGYTQKVGARIKSNTVFNVPEGLAGNPAVEFAVELLPDGSIRALNKVKSSGVPGFDEAVQRAIGKSAPFPPDKTGRVPAGFNVVHHPKDQ